MKGLELRASVSLVKTGYEQARFTTMPFYYYLNPETGYDFETGEHTLTLVQNGRRTLEQDGSGTVVSASTQWTYEGQLLHTAAWGNHQTSLVAVLQAQQSSSVPSSSLFEGLEHRNMSFSMRGSYGFKDR